MEKNTDKIQMSGYPHLGRSGEKGVKGMRTEWIQKHSDVLCLRLCGGDMDFVLLFFTPSI